MAGGSDFEDRKVPSCHPGRGDSVNKSVNLTNDNDESNDEAWSDDSDPDDVYSVVILNFLYAC